MPNSNSPRNGSAATTPVTDEIGAKLAAVLAEKERQKQLDEEQKQHAGKIQALSEPYGKADRAIRDAGRRLTCDEAAVVVVEQFAVFTSKLREFEWLHFAEDWRAETSEDRYIKAALLDPWTVAEVSKLLQLYHEGDGTGSLADAWFRLLADGLPKLTPPQLPAEARPGREQAPAPAVDVSRRRQTEPPSPKQLLIGWREIVAAVGRTSKDRETIRRLNERRAGPIGHAGQGTKPMVDRAKLIAWWNSLDVMQQELANQQQGCRLSAESQHDYGRDGTVAPEVGGGVKKRRRDKKT
jgi:hypothetical protein